MEKIYLIHRHVIERSRFSFHVLIGGEPGELFEVVDKVRLVEVSALQGNIPPADSLIILNRLNRFLKAYDPEILLGRDTHVPPEQVNEVFLRIPDFAA